MALPIYATPLERIWFYTYRTICVAVFIFLVAPILIVIPLSFNVEPYFSFTQKMITFDPTGYSLRWYDTLLTLGLNSPDGPRDSAWWSQVWEQATWVKAAKNSLWIGLWATVVATVLGTTAALGLSRPEMPLSAADHGDPDFADDRADHHHRDGAVLFLFAGLCVA